MARSPVKVGEVADAIAARIAAGEWRAGEWLPSRARLAGQYGVATSTVRRALGELAARGLVALVEQRGAQVTAGVAGAFDGWAAAPVGDGYVDLVCRQVPAVLDVAERLGVPLGVTVTCWTGERGQIGADGGRVPVELIGMWAAPTARVADLADAPGDQVIARLAALGLHWEDVISAGAVCTGERVRLGSGELVTVWRRAYDAAGRPVLVCRRVVRTDRAPLVYRSGHDHGGCGS